MLQLGDDLVGNVVVKVAARATVSGAAIVSGHRDELRDGRRKPLFQSSTRHGKPVRTLTLKGALRGLPADGGASAMPVPTRGKAFPISGIRMSAESHKRGLWLTSFSSFQSKLTRCVGGVADRSGPPTHPLEMVVTLCAVWKTSDDRPNLVGTNAKACRKLAARKSGGPQDPLVATGLAYKGVQPVIANTMAAEVFA